MDPYTVQYLSMYDGDITKANHTKTNKKHKNKTSKQNTKNKQKTRIVAMDKLALCELAAAYYVLMVEPCVHRTRHRNKTHHNRKAPGKVQTTINALRKPGVPPARIPEITTRPEMEPESAHVVSAVSVPYSSYAAIAMQHHPGNIHQSLATPRYSATPWNVLLQLPNVIDTISKRWRSKKPFNISPFHIFP